MVSLEHRPSARRSGYIIGDANTYIKVTPALKKIEFYVDGVLVATHSTRIPTAVLDWQHLIIGLTTGGGDTISVTVRNGGCQECPS